MKNIGDFADSNFKLYFDFSHREYQKRRNLGQTFPCLFCPKRYTTERWLETHSRRKHHEEASNFLNQSCLICGQKFHFTESLARHVIKKHPGTENLETEESLEVPLNSDPIEGIEEGLETSKNIDLSFSASQEQVVDFSNLILSPTSLSS